MSLTYLEMVYENTIRQLEHDQRILFVCIALNLTAAALSLVRAFT